MNQCNAIALLNIEKGAIVTIGYANGGGVYIVPYKTNAGMEPNGMAARDIKKCEEVNYNPLDDTQDILVQFPATVDVRGGFIRLSGGKSQ